MYNMKFSETRSDYEDLENSIVDSLSEVSIGSNALLNNHTQEIINKSISDVITAYLWHTDLSKLAKSNALESRVSVNKSSRKSKSSFTNESEIDKQVKSAWDSVDLNKNPSTNAQNVDAKNNSKKDDKYQNSNKIPIPYLDLSYLSENNTSTMNNSNEEPNKQEHESVPKKNLQRQRSHEANLFSLNAGQKSIEIKSKTSSDSNIKRNEYQTHSSVKYEIECLLKELRLNKNSDSSEYFNQDNESKLSRAEQDKLFSMAVNLRDLLTRLLEKRKLAKRNTHVEKMTREEIQCEKVDTQKELLAFEEKHGRPQTKMEKDLMRPLYDHYRKVKRILSKNSSANQDLPSNDDNVMGEEDEVVVSNFKDNKHFINLHSMTLNELNKEKETVLHEKSKLKDMIKKYENEFVKLTGRSLSKEDRDYHKDEFERYKFLKAKLKFIDALIDKYESNKK